MDIFAIPETITNKQEAIAAVSKNGLQLEFCSEELQNDLDVVIEAILNSPIAIQYASPRIRQNRQVALIAAKLNGNILSYLTEGLRKDKELVLTAVSNHGLALRFAPTFANDKQIVYTAVTNMSSALQFASAEFKDDYELVKMAVSEPQSHALAMASNRLKNNKTIVLEAITNGHGSQYSYASSSLQYDEDVAIAALKKWPAIIISLKCYNNLRVMLEAAKLTGSAFNRASERIQENAEFVKTAVVAFPDVLTCVGPTFANNVPFLIEVVRLNPNVLRHVCKQVYQNPDFKLGIALIDFHTLHRRLKHQQTMLHLCDCTFYFFNKVKTS